MILQEGRLRFDFSNALNGFKFDEEDKDNPNFHGLSHCMKAVDFIVEFQDYYLFVEIKNPKATDQYTNDKKGNELIKALVTKFRDSLVYRWAEEKTDKPIRYLCLLELDNAQILHVMNELKRQLPEVGPVGRWKKPIAESCVVVNRARWNSSFKEWQVSQI